MLNERAFYKLCLDQNDQPTKTPFLGELCNANIYKNIIRKKS